MPKNPNLKFNSVQAHSNENLEERIIAQDGNNYAAEVYDSQGYLRYMDCLTDDEYHLACYNQNSILTRQVDFNSSNKSYEFTDYYITGEVKQEFGFKNGIPYSRQYYKDGRLKQQEIS